MAGKRVPRQEKPCGDRACVTRKRASAQKNLGFLATNERMLSASDFSSNHKQTKKHHHTHNLFLKSFPEASLQALARRLSLVFPHGACSSRALRSPRFPWFTTSRVPSPSPGSGQTSGIVLWGGKSVGGLG